MDMSKNQVLKFIPIEAEKDFDTVLRQISVSSLLKYVYELSKEVYFGGCTIENLYKEIIETDPRSGKTIKQEVYIQPWQFPDLLYCAIRCSNDYRGLNFLTRNMLLMLLCTTNEYISLNEKDSLEKLKPMSPFDINLFAYGFAGEQFKYETPLLLYRTLIRELYIIFGISRKCNSTIISDLLIKKETGIEWKDLIKSLFGIFIDSLFDGCIHPSVDRLAFDSDKDKEEIYDRIVEYYSTDYDEIRNNPLGRQIFYTKPFIRTQNNGLCTASVYFNQFIVEHAPFWVLRNYFQKLDKSHQQDFTNEFGKWFEFYLHEMCTSFGFSCKKIEETNKKRADWKIIIGKHVFLVEQKSAILQLSIKQQLTDFSEYKKAIEKTVFKALSQLQQTEDDLNIYKPIKIILCYDDYIDPNILPLAFDEKACKTKNDNRFFIANILEIEMLLSLASSNMGLFDTVVEDMLNRNASSDKEGVSLLKIMRDNGFSTDLYWTSPVFDEYKKLLEDIKNSHEKFREL